MFEENLQKHSLNYHDFEKLRQDGCIYVDKTDQILEIAKLYYTSFFLRPRLTGKTLLLSTLKSLFEHGVEYFKGLKIEKLWDEETYPVLSLDFSKFDCDNSKNFSNQIRDGVIEFIKSHNLDIEYEEDENFEGVLFDLLYKDKARRIVLLVDDYDALLIKNLKNFELYDEYQRILETFFIKTKAFSTKFRLVFITGRFKYNN